MELFDRFKKNRTLVDELKLHVAGATVRHKSPFEDLTSYTNDVEISQSFREEWVIPFYRELKKNSSDEWIRKMIELAPSISEEVILKTLGDFNWRTRSTGAYFASIKNETRFTDIIGTHLLKSEVCYAGSQYAITLATFNTKEAIEYLNKYLAYYLKRTDLYFDQTQVMSSIKYLDEQNGTNFSEQHLDQWTLFCESRIESIKKSVENSNFQHMEGMRQDIDGQLKFWQEDISSKSVADKISVIDKIKKGIV